MTGELHEVSRAIGGLETATQGLQRSFDQHCEDDDRRHSENITELRSIGAEIAKINQTLAPLMQTVKAMKPIVESYQVSRAKQAGAWSLAVAIVWGLGWLTQLLAEKLLGFLHSWK